MLTSSVDIFSQPELMIQFKASQIRTAFADKKLTSKISTQDWTESHLEQVKCLLEKVLEGLFKMKLQGSEQLQTVFAMYNQELSRDCVAPSCEKLRRMERQHIDQTIRTRNIKPEMIELRLEIWSKVVKGAMSAQKAKCEIAIRGRQMDSARKDIPVVSGVSFW